MRILFIHQNFPGQFLSLAPALAEKGHTVVALTCRSGLPDVWSGVRIFRYKWPDKKATTCHRWLTSLNAATERGEAVFRAAMVLKSKGFLPDIIVAHTGWGEALFLRDVWPGAKLAAFSELWYRNVGGDLGFDPEFPLRDPAGSAPRLRMKNAVQAMQIGQSAALFTATRWQAESYPRNVSANMKVLHEGIDTGKLVPDPGSTFEIPGGPVLTRSDRVVSFVNRNLEPLRGFHVFMRALPKLLAEDTGVRIVIVGDAGVSYGTPPEDGGSWKDKLLAEVAPKLTDDQLARVHFVGRLPHSHLTRLFQVAGAHVYLTYPFVPSWSLLEAMSCGVPVIGSDVAPVAEFVTSGENGLLVDFFDHGALASEIIRLLDDRTLAESLGAAARESIVQCYDKTSICLPNQIRFVEALGLPSSEVSVADPKLARTG